MITAWALQVMGKDRKLQTLHLIDSAAYKQKEHLQFIKLRLNMQENNNEYTNARDYVRKQ